MTIIIVHRWAMEARSGRLPFSKLDVLHRRNLDIVLEDFGLERVGDATRSELNLAWHRPDAWPDVREGLARGLQAEGRRVPLGGRGGTARRLHRPSGRAGAGAGVRPGNPAR